MQKYCLAKLRNVNSLMEFTATFAKNEEVYARKENEVSIFFGGKKRTEVSSCSSKGWSAIKVYQKNYVCAILSCFLSLLDTD